MTALVPATLGALQFVRPIVLLLLLVLPVWWYLRARFRPPAITFSRAELLSHGPKGGSVVPRVVFVLQNVVLLGLTLSLARPRLRGHSETSTSQGINIALVIDLSSSMLALDFQPRNRLEVAKATVKRFILGRSSDRIGLVAFAAEALTQVPLTTDYPVLLQAVDNLQAGQLEDGTAIGNAIATAANRLRHAPGSSRVMILLTDGVNNRGDIAPLTAARAAAEFGIRIYAIGVGTKGVASVPVGRGMYGLIYQDQPVEIDEVLLNTIAHMTGGQYFRAYDAAALQRIYQRIDALERAPVQSTTYVRYTELFRWPLGFAAAALLCSLMLTAARAPLP